ncbi:MAG: hypothetical protein JWP97_2732 [Labilithrix sp.]|nr:hypothetical protein [Labilithrix sp.]
MGLGNRLAGSTAVRLAVFALLALALVYTSLEHAGSINEFRDAQVLIGYERAAVDTVRHFGQLPLWNPYYCGGLDGVGAPQSRFASPTLLVSLLFGAERGEIVLVFLFAVLGMEGTYRWLRTRVSSPAAAAVVAPVFALSGQFAVAYFRGWTNFFGFELVPWILLGLTLAGRGRVRGVAIASVAFAVMLGFGGSFAAPLVAVAAAVESLRILHEQAPGTRRRALLMLLVTASFMFAASLVRLWPIAETLEAAPRIMAGTPGHLPRALYAAITTPLTSKDGDILLPGSFFVGTAFLALAALGATDRKALRGLLAVFVFVWLAAGYLRKPSLFGLLRELPVFSALRYPERFLWLAILFACEPAAHALAKIPLVGEGRRWRVAVWAVLGGAVAFTIVGEIGAFHRVAAQRSLFPIRDGEPLPFRQSRGNRWVAAHVEALGLGSLSCWETHPVVQTPLLRADLPAEEYLSEATRDAGTVKRISWSPNRIVVHASVTKPARLLVNQNWHPGWHASGGTVVSDGGLLAVDVPAGEHDVELRFRPWSTVGGGLVSLTALAMLGALALRTRRHGDLWSRAARLGTAACCVAPWLVFGAAYALSPDPRFPAPAAHNANGTPALLADGEPLPPDVVRTDATFDLPLTVLAGSVHGPDVLGIVSLDVYLRRTGRVPRSTTMFVHLERRGGKVERPTKGADKPRDSFYNADHQVLAGSFYLSDAPAGRLVHDARGVRLKDAESGTWDVWVAFGHVSGARGRAAVTSPGAATVSENRVRIGTFTVR